MKKKNLIQIGCNEGNDHVFNFVKDNYQDLDQIFLIDANDKCYDKIKDQYGKFPINYEFIHLALVPEYNINEVIFYRGIYEYCAHGSLKKNHLIEHHHDLDKIFEFTVPAKNINALFKEKNLSIIDYLFIDIEGMDVDIINSINFNEFEINYIQFEHVHSDGTHSNGGNKLRECLNKIKDIYNINFNGGDCILIKK
jgi:FkbM family methyltransferase